MELRKPVACLAAAGVVVALAALMSGLAAQTPSRSGGATAPPEPPRLVVLLVIDQFRADYAELYGRQWSKGLRRLFDRGAVFPLAAYPYAGTVTCPGHATISTGTFPFVHGMSSNTWFDRGLRRSMGCVTDLTATSVPFAGGVGKEQHSSRAFRSPAFADELRLQARRPPSIVSVALKPRSAISLGGRGGPNTVVVWEEDDGTWATSDAYTKTPWPDVDEYVRQHPMASAYGQTWTRLLPESAYLYEDDAPGENTPTPWTRTFPHPHVSPTGKPDITFVSNWERSPLSDQFVVDLAITLLDRRQLGRQPGTDLLALSLPALDLVGHEFGPRSHEVQDVLARADAALGRLFDALDRGVGLDRYVVAFSSDHGVAPIPEQAAQLGMDAGRIAVATIRETVDRSVASYLGQGAYYALLGDQQLALTSGTLPRLGSRSGALLAVKNAIAEVPGVSRVYGPDELADTGPTDDPLLRAWRLSYVPGRSGDFVLIPKPYWIIRATGTTHGSPYDYDTRVPLVLIGAGIRPGRYLVAASPVDIAPTLAALTGITLARTHGRVLAEAVAR